MPVHLTQHAIQRGQERLGLAEKALLRHANKVYEKGLSIEDTKGSLRTFLEIKRKNGEATDIKVYGESIYLFHDTRLITITPIPNVMKRYMRKKVKHENTNRDFTANINKFISE